MFLMRLEPPFFKLPIQHSTTKAQQQEFYRNFLQVCILYLSFSFGNGDRESGPNAAKCSSLEANWTSAI